MFALVENTSNEIVAISKAPIEYGYWGAVVDGVTHSDMFPSNSSVIELSMTDEDFIGRAFKLDGVNVVSNPSFSKPIEEEPKEPEDIIVPLSTTPTIVSIGGVDYSVLFEGTISIKLA